MERLQAAIEKARAQRDETRAAPAPATPAQPVAAQAQAPVEQDTRSIVDEAWAA